MMCDMEKKKLAVIGNGYLAGILAQAWEKGLLESYRFVGVLGRSREKTEALARRLGCRACFALGELMEEGPDYVVEAASVEAVKSCGEAVLSGGADLLVLSIGAFADASFYEKMERCAFRNLCKQPVIKAGNLRSAVISALRGLLACPTGKYPGCACEKRDCAPFDAISRFFYGLFAAFLPLIAP